MRKFLWVALFLISCKPHTENMATPIPVRMENRRLPDRDGDPAAWNVVCVDGVEYLWAYNVGVTPKMRPKNDRLVPTLCEVR